MKPTWYLASQLYLGFGGIVYGASKLDVGLPLKILIIAAACTFGSLLMDIRALLAWPEQAREELEK